MARFSVKSLKLKCKLTRENIIMAKKPSKQQYFDSTNSPVFRPAGAEPSAPINRKLDHLVPPQGEPRQQDQNIHLTENTALTGSGDQTPLRRVSQCPASSSDMPMGDSRMGDSMSLRPIETALTQKASLPFGEDADQKKRLNARERRASETLPGGRFPMPPGDKDHARNALARLNQAHGLSEADKAKVRARARRILGQGHFDPSKKEGK